MGKGSTIYRRKRSSDYNGLKITGLGITTHLEQPGDKQNEKYTQSYCQNY